MAVRFVLAAWAVEGNGWFLLREGGIRRCVVRLLGFIFVVGVGIRSGGVAGG